MVIISTMMEAEVIMTVDIEKEVTVVKVEMANDMEDIINPEMDLEMDLLGIVKGRLLAL